MHNTIMGDIVRQNLNLTKSLEGNISVFKEIFNNDETFLARRFQNKYLTAAKCCLLYIEGMADIGILNENIIQPVLCDNLAKQIDSENLLEELSYKVIASGNIQIVSDVNCILEALLNGNSALMVEGYGEAIVISSRGWKTRAITEPESARVVRGPREGFTESICINISLVRRRIKDTKLKFKYMELGARTHTKVCICYIEDLARDEILKELESRLGKIEIDAILDSGYIQELIRDEPFSLFETVGASERPDVIASKVLEGRIALFVDGSPFVLTVPYILAETSQANEDYYNNFISASINRFYRITSSILAMVVPSLFLALTTYHQEMLPTPLLISISASRQGVPFPTTLSLFAMLVLFDFLREAGTRMPSPIGQAVNIVGTLVLGQAAVEAKLVSAPVVIISALTGILTLMNKNLMTPIMIYRFVFLLATSVLGIYGLIFAFLLMSINLMTMRSFGVPYMLNISSLSDHNAQDVWIRAPWWTMTLRPKIIGARNLVRQKTSGVKRTK